VTPELFVDDEETLLVRLRNVDVTDIAEIRNGRLGRTGGPGNQKHEEQ
jgi:hypothetical protein